MFVSGIDIDIDSRVLKEWSKLNKEIEQGITNFFTEPVDCSHNMAIGYLPYPPKPGWGLPVPKDCHVMLQALALYRFSETDQSLQDMVILLRGAGMNVSSTQAVQNMFDRVEFAIGILPKPTKVMLAKFKAHRDLLKALRLRRIHKKEQRLQRARTKKAKELQLEIEKGSRASKKRIVKGQIKDKELREFNVEATIERLKKEGGASKYEVEPEIDPADIVFEPTPKQAEFLASGETVVFYGGAAGGGKSYCLLMDAVRFAHRPAMRSLIIRRRNSELKELISVSSTLYPKAFPGAKFNQSKMMWTFPSGGTLEFGYFEKEDDKERYIGLPYSYIAWDEIQLQKSPEGFDFLFSRLRTTDPEITCYVRATGNPGGAPWVKQRFIDPAPYGVPFLRGDKENPEDAISYKFIPATLFDNPYLTADGEYEKILKQLPPAKVRQLLYGDWDIVEDGFFSFLKSDHVKADLPPMHWSIISSMDYGWVDPASCLWAKVDPVSNSLFVYRESEMMQVPVSTWAQKLREAEASEHFVKVADRVIDASLFKQTGHTGPSHLQTLANFQINPRPADRNREAGWEQVNERLMFEEGGEPKLFIHESCVKLIDQLQTAQSRATNPNDIDEARVFSYGRKHHWDLLDCLRYLCMARPRSITTDMLLLNSKKTAQWNKYNSYFD